MAIFEAMELMSHLTTDRILTLIGGTTIAIDLISRCITVRITLRQEITALAGTHPITATLGILIGQTPTLLHTAGHGIGAYGVGGRN